MASSLSWIYFSDEDRKRTQDYLRSLSEGMFDALRFEIELSVKN
jgi:hypothetical protein